MMKTTLIFSLVVLGIADDSGFKETDNSMTYIDSLSFDKTIHVEWKYEKTTNEMLFNVTWASLKGWAAVGISKTNYNMTGLDIILCNASSGKIMDYSAKGLAVLEKDSQQDGELMSFNSSDTSRILNSYFAFKRKLNTGDTTGDIVITAGEKYYLAYAYFSRNGNLQKHENQGYSSLKMLVPAQPPQLTTTAVASSTQVSGTKTPTKPSCAAGICGLHSALLLFPYVFVAMFFC